MSRFRACLNKFNILLPVFFTVLKDVKSLKLQHTNKFRTNGLSALDRDGLKNLHTKKN